MARPLFAVIYTRSCVVHPPSSHHYVPLGWSQCTLCPPWYRQSLHRAPATLTAQNMTAHCVPFIFSRINSSNISQILYTPLLYFMPTVDIFLARLRYEKGHDKGILTVNKDWYYFVNSQQYAFHYKIFSRLL